MSTAQQDEIAKLRTALRFLLEAVERITYRRTGNSKRVFVGVHGDTDVTGDLYGPIEQAKRLLKL